MCAFIPSSIPRAFVSSTRQSLCLCNTKPRLLPSSRSQSTATRTVMADTTAPPLDNGMVLFAKAGPDGSCMGDCPFTMKANLALRFKQADFQTHFIDLSNKPAWFLDLNEDGTTPVFIDGNHAIGDSDEIVEYAEKVGRNKELALTREDDERWNGAFDVVSPVFGSLVRLLKNKEADKENELKDALEKAVRGVNTFLESGDGPFLLGDKISALDCNLAPKLHHVMIAAKHYKGFEIPADCTRVMAYMNNIRATEEWKASQCDDDVIIWGWSKFFS